MRRTLRGSVLVLAVALALLVAGVVVFASAGSAGSADFGWSAYAPLSAATPVTTGSVLWTPRQGLGAALVVLGLLVAAGVAGYGVGRRAGR